MAQQVRKVSVAQVEGTAGGDGGGAGGGEGDTKAMQMQSYVALLAHRESVLPHALCPSCTPSLKFRAPVDLYEQPEGRSLVLVQAPKTHADVSERPSSPAAA